MSAIKVEIDRGVVVVSVELENLVPEEAIQQVYRETMAVIEKKTGCKLVLDFSRVAFMSSSCLGMMLRVHKEVRKRRIELKFAGFNTSIEDILNQSGLVRVFDIHPTAADAIKAMSLFESAYSIVSRYYHAVLEGIAEDIVDHESEFAEAHLFNADNLIDKYAHELWNIAALREYLRPKSRVCRTREFHEIDCANADQIQSQVNQWLTEHREIRPLSLVVLDTGESRRKCLILCEVTREV